ncbi:MAG TPA: bifunctional 5,10-methylenetetrahydrofolate dehydrogenase/5,10-methenyltetrahydrofolate cyclohydrolase [Verrucomicrobiae bacterium]|nr:bifunctional 5,10-methylenetetrahydrofolate dehydrogenase/5,10-methenyltetrahydrofolate cyclohydrolase [Verrucomicrobiae bacterium]
MTATIIDGLLVSKQIKENLKNEITHLADNNIYPCLSTILIGDDPPSISYINNKQKSANLIGIKTRDYRLDENVSEKELIDLIQSLNKDDEVHGILLQLPLKKHLNKFNILNSIDSKKDVDGLTFYNSGLLSNNKAELVPCTPIGIMELLRHYKIELNGVTTTIINRSNLVGKPLASLLLEENSTVIICHSHTKNLNNLLQSSDIIITAVGNRNKFELTDEMIKENSTIIDVGTSRVNGKLLGDVNFEKVKEKAAYITPVPGGVGPMTITMLLKNTVKAAKLINKIQ